MPLSSLDQAQLATNCSNILLSYGYDNPIDPAIIAELQSIISYQDALLEIDCPSIYQDTLACTIPPLTSPQAIKDCTLFQKFREYSILCEWLRVYPERGDEFLNNQACKLSCENQCISTSSISMPAGESIKYRDFDIYKLLSDNAIKPISYFCQLANQFLCQLIPCDEEIGIRFLNGARECAVEDNGCC